MSDFAVMLPYYRLRTKMEVISAWDGKPTEDYETVLLRRNFNGLIQYMDEICDQPSFCRLAARGSHQTFREGWDLLVEYREDWENPPLPVIDDDWKGQAADFRRILELWEDVKVL